MTSLLLVCASATLDAGEREAIVAVTAGRTSPGHTERAHRGITLAAEKMHDMIALEVATPVCPYSRLLSCTSQIVLESRAPNWFLFLVLLDRSEKEAIASALLLDAKKASSILAGSGTEEEIEQKMFASAVRTGTVAVKIARAEEIATHVESLVLGAFAQPLFHGQKPAPLGAVELQFPHASEVAIELDQKALGRATGPKIRIENVRPRRAKIVASDPLEKLPVRAMEVEIISAKTVTAEVAQIELPPDRSVLERASWITWTSAGVALAGATLAIAAAASTQNDRVSVCTGGCAASVNDRFTTIEDLIGGPAIPAVPLGLSLVIAGGLGAALSVAMAD